jgi:hypothetical protein
MTKTSPHPLPLPAEERGMMRGNMKYFWLELWLFGFGSLFGYWCSDFGYCILTPTSFIAVMYSSLSRSFGMPWSMKSQGKISSKSLLR